MPIDIYSIRYSPPCRAVLMTAKHLNIDLNVITVNLSEGQNLKEDYLKINPMHQIPAINDNGFILWESRAIMQYLCNQTSPDSQLYPKEPKQRAVVDRWLNYDLSLFGVMKENVAIPKFMGSEPTEQAVKTISDTLKLLDQLIGSNKYLAGNKLTIADLSVLATTYTLVIFGKDLTPYPNLNTWITKLSEELPYFDEFNTFSKEDVDEFVNKMRAFVHKKMGKNGEVPPARAVLMLTKELKLDIKEQLTDLAAGQHYEPDFLNLNPCHTVPTMNDNGFILWESRAIMQYLCDKYAPDSQLYPKDLKQRALVDRWLYTDATGFLFIRDITFFSQLLPVVTNWTKFAFNNHLQVLNKMIGDWK
ncbi:unnamed protein product, partial [Medioppia subpectinata]